MEYTPADYEELRAGFETLLDMQKELQLVMKPVGRDPSKLVGDEQSEFMTWNAWALVEELKEAMDEVQWKPWAEKKGLHRVNTDLFAKEMVDLLHFFANLCLAAGVDAEDLAQGYVNKRKRNAERQEEGYDGVTGKCPKCKRSYDDVGSVTRVTGGYGWPPILRDYKQVCASCYREARSSRPAIVNLDDEGDFDD